MNDLRPHRPTNGNVHHDRRPLFITAVATVVACAVIALTQSGSDKHTASASTIAPSIGFPGVSSLGDTAAAPSPASTTVAAVDAPGAAVTPLAAGDDATPPTTAGVVTTDGTAATGDLDGGDNTTSDSCTLSQRSIGVGDSGADINCLQNALISAGYLSGAPSGTYDNATYAAVKKIQTEKDMFVDGIVGRETAISLGIWPDEQSLVVRTPKPAPGAKDLLGYPLSSVATSGPDAPPLPDNSGSGKRLVYSRAGQRVWAVDANERVIRSWLVSGSKYNNEVPGVHQVFSKSETSTAWNGKALLPHMVRYAKTRIGAIGFHGIPRHVSDGSRYQTDDELGTRLSGGCTRQADLDANFVWDFAQVGTTVIVL
jgi:hypothetical protein